MASAMVDLFVRDLSRELKISIPQISYDTSKFETPTMLAMCEDGIIYIPQMDKPTPDLLFAIAHEMRHQWQIKNDKDLYFSNYKPSALLSIEEYNLQLAEIDANAFGFYVMITWIGLQPLYEGLPQTVIDATTKYIEEHFM